MQVLTASCVICIYMCITNIFKKEIELCFFWLGIALIIDVIDGPIARKLDVKNKYPSLNGLMLDTIVDYINFKSNSFYKSYDNFKSLKYRMSDVNVTMLTCSFMC